MLPGGHSAPRLLSEGSRVGCSFRGVGGSEMPRGEQGVGSPRLAQAGLAL